MRDAAKATKKDVVRNFVKWALNLALIKKQPSRDSSTSLVSKVLSAKELFGIAKKPTKKDVTYNFTKFIIATAFTPKDLRPSQAKEVIRHLALFSIQIFKDPEFRRRIHQERRSRA